MELATGDMLGDEGSETKVFPREVQRLKMIPRADTKSHLWHPRVNTILNFDSPRADSGKIVT